MPTMRTWPSAAFLHSCRPLGGRSSYKPIGLRATNLRRSSGGLVCCCLPAPISSPGEHSYPAGDLTSKDADTLESRINVPTDGSRKPRTATGRDLFVAPCLQASSRLFWQDIPGRVYQRPSSDPGRFSTSVENFGGPRVLSAQRSLRGFPARSFAACDANTVTVERTLRPRSGILPHIAGGVLPPAEREPEMPHRGSCTKQDPRGWLPVRRSDNGRRPSELVHGDHRVLDRAVSRHTNESWLGGPQSSSAIAELAGGIFVRLSTAVARKQTAVFQTDRKARLAALSFHSLALCEEPASPLPPFQPRDRNAGVGFFVDSTFPGHPVAPGEVRGGPCDGGSCRCRAANIAKRVEVQGV